MALNRDYKKWHKPVSEEKSKYHQGYFTPKNLEKCVSRENIYRSGWEFQFMRWCDSNPNILRWASEPIPIKYYNPVANLEYCKQHGLNARDPKNWKLCNYHTDFWIELKEDSGNVSKIFIEIKPKAQTMKPAPINESASLKEHRAYNRAAETYLINMAKWAAAKKYFEERGCRFMIFTEDTLTKLGLL